MICLGHGPVLEARIPEIVGLYKEWSTGVNPQAQEGRDHVLLGVRLHRRDGGRGEGVDNIMDGLMQGKMKVMEGLKIKFKPSKGERLSSALTSAGVSLMT